jgi:hypothetical protein
MANNDDRPRFSGREWCRGRNGARDAHHGSLMPRQTTLKPRVQTLSTQRVATLEAKAGTTKRIRGRAWMTTRQRVAVAQQFKCQRWRMRVAAVA